MLNYTLIFDQRRRFESHDRILEKSETDTVADNTSELVSDQLHRRSFLLTNHAPVGHSRQNVCAESDRDTRKYRKLVFAFRISSS